ESATWAPSIATGDYAGVYGIDPALVQQGFIEAAAPGIVSKTDKVRLTDVTDGLSNTIHLTESAGKPDLYQAGKVVGLAPNPHVQGGGWCRPASEVPYVIGLDSTGTAAGTQGINAANGFEVTAYPDPKFVTDGTGQIYGFHSGGVNALFGDGSVRFIRQSISIRTLAALI